MAGVQKCATARARGRVGGTVRPVWVNPCGLSKWPLHPVAVCPTFVDASAVRVGSNRFNLMIAIATGEKPGPRSSAPNMSHPFTHNTVSSTREHKTTKQAVTQPSSDTSTSSPRATAPISVHPPASRLSSQSVSQPDPTILTHACGRVFFLLPLQNSQNTHTHTHTTTQDVARGVPEHV